jgi:hypothetical protein
VSCAVSGDMTGEACWELEATDEELMADAGKEAEGMEGGNEVWTCAGRARRYVGVCMAIAVNGW